jgi:hypothetical protein
MSEIIVHSNFMADPDSKMTFEWVGPEDGEVPVALPNLHLIDCLPWKMEQVRIDRDERTIYFKRVNP